MKKVLASLLVLFVFMVGLPLATNAQTCRTRRVSRSSYNRNYRSARPTYYATRGYNYQRPSFYRRHRNLVNLGVAAGGGTLIGALLGGRRGAGAGALIGLGSGALYTYVLNKKKRRY